MTTSIDIHEAEKAFKTYNLMNYLRYIYGEYDLVEYYINKGNLYAIHRQQVEDIFTR